MKRLLCLVSGILLLSVLSCREADEETSIPTTSTLDSIEITAKDGDPLYPPRR